MRYIQEHSGPTITTKSVAKYALLPGILPRLLRISQIVSRFLFMFTQMFGSLGLIDRNHPCLRAENIGRYRFTDIIGLAASNLVLDRKHLPQTIMFGVVISSLLLTIGIFLALAASIVMQAGTAHAQFFGSPESYGYDAKHDWALRFLYRIFGENSFFGGPQAGEAVGNPWLTAILGGMLRYYSLAILVVAAFMILYILVISLTEAARSGKPFGSRFDSIWAPIRLALAIGLLVPIMSPGYNGAQMLVFQSAVWGSNLATNVWYGGLKALDGQNAPKIFSASMSDPGYRFVRDIFLINLCIQSFEDITARENHPKKVYYRKVRSEDGYMTLNFGPLLTPSLCGQVTYLARSKDAAKPAGIAYSWPEDTVNAYNEIAKIFLPVPPEVLDKNLAVGFGETVIPAKMADVVKGTSAYIVRSPNDESFSTVVSSASKMVTKYYAGQAHAGSSEVMSWITAYREKLGSTIDKGEYTPFFTTDDHRRLLDQYNSWLMDNLKQDAQYGWTTAGVFYLRISAAMATISRIVNNPPRVSIMPTNFTKPFATDDDPAANTEEVTQRCTGWSRLWNFRFCAKYEGALERHKYIRGGQSWFLNSVRDDPAAYKMVGTLTFDNLLDVPDPETETNMDTGFILRPVYEALSGLVRIQSNDLNPLGRVVGWGNVLLNAGMVSIGIGLLGKGLAISSMAYTFGMILLIPGFLLAFYVPMIPFLQFSFAVIEWMISILEAVIGMPLFALSLITLQGDGLGEMGTNNIKQLFEIILRPTVVVIALVVSVLVFTAGVAFFNGAMELLASGYSQGVDGSWFSDMGAAIGMVLLYMFGIYSIATSSFKLISIIPDNFGRWAGLEKGFGADLKVGVLDQTDKLIAGGVAIKIFSDLGGSANKAAEARHKRKLMDRMNSEKNG